MLNSCNRRRVVQKDKESARLDRMLAIRDGEPVVRTTEQSEFNRALEANRPNPKYSHCSQDTLRGRMFTQYEMHQLRRMEQIWPNSVEYDAENLRS